MMVRILGVAAAALLAFLLGWFAPPRAEPPSSATAATRLAVSAVTRPGIGVEVATRELARLNPPPPPPKPLGPVRLPPAAPPPPPPPPPDIADVLRASVTAVVVDRAGGLELVVAPVAGAPQRRVLHTGDIFADDWRIASIDRRGASLERRGERRIVAFYASTGA